MNEKNVCTKNLNVRNHGGGQHPSATKIVFFFVRKGEKDAKCSET